MKRMITPGLVILLWVCPGFPQGSPERLSIGKAQALIDKMISEHKEDVTLQVTEVFLVEARAGRLEAYPTAFAWCNVFRGDQYVGSTTIPFRGARPTNEIWRRAFRDALPMDMEEQTRLLAALKRMRDTLSRIEAGPGRLDQILPDNLTDHTDSNGGAWGIFKPEDIRKRSGDQIRELIRNLLDSFLIQGIAASEGLMSAQEMEDSDDRLRAREERNDEQFEELRTAAKILSEPRSRVLSLDQERLKEAEILIVGLFTGQVHKDSNYKHDGALSIRGLPGSAPLYHIGNSQFGFYVTWFGDELKIVSMLID